MKGRLLTNAELRAIRSMPCGRCGKHPPYADGSMTQKHRIKPGSKGGRYTKRNTVPRCPDCHSKEWNHTPQFIKRTPAQRRETARKGGKRMRATYTPEERSVLARHAGRQSFIAMRAKYTAKELSALKRAAGRKGGMAGGAHTRWHVKRRIVNPTCRFCTNK